MRIALGVEYDGAPFCGWQIQKGVLTVQECVERALSAVANHEIRVACAGRTDTGVHACGQVIHFDSNAQRQTKAWVMGANANLPKGISVLWARQVNDQFHARFSALRRSYRYVIYNRSVRPTFLAQRVSWCYRPLDEARMAEAAQYLVGEHDFSSYRTLACQAKHPVRTLYRLEVSRQDQWVFLDVEANGFLHHMVRNIAGVLMTIGAGEKQPVWAQEVLQARDRTLGGVTASPDGLYFHSVAYSPDFDLPTISPPFLVW